MTRAASAPREVQRATTSAKAHLVAVLDGELAADANFPFQDVPSKPTGRRGWDYPEWRS